MRRILKDHFIPHNGNDYKPHFLRTKVVVGLLALIIAVEGFYLAQTLVIFPKSDYLAAIFATVLIDQTNEVRVAEALAHLTPNPVLEQVAQMKADDMAAKGYFAHNSPDGKTPWYWFRQAGYQYVAAGENLAVNFTDSKDVTDAWLRSPSHRANIMNGNYTEIGIATAQGYYKGKEAIFVVEVFGRPKSVTEVPPPTIPVSAPALSQAVKTKPVETAPTPPPAPTPSETPVTPPTSVAGAETSVAKELSVETLVLEEVAPIETEAALPPPVVNAAPERAPFFAALLASPRHLTMTFYLFLGALLLVALALTIFIEIRVQHPHLVVGGFFLLFVLVGLSIVNTTVSLAQGVV